MSSVLAGVHAVPVLLWGHRTLPAAWSLFAWRVGASWDAATAPSRGRSPSASTRSAPALAPLGGTSWLPVPEPCPAEQEDGCVAAPPYVGGAPGRSTSDASERQPGRQLQDLGRAEDGLRPWFQRGSEHLLLRALLHSRQLLPQELGDGTVGNAASFPWLQSQGGVISCSVRTGGAAGSPRGTGGTLAG